MMFLIKFKTVRQISQDHWDVYFEEKLVNGNTTIAEIKEWVLLKTGGDNINLLTDVILSEPEQKEEGK